MNPFNHRPFYHPEFPDDDDEGWEDNPASNFMAWFAETFMPNWCQSPDHWTVRLVLYLWADCSCCLAFRFFALGVLFGLALGLVCMLLVT